MVALFLLAAALHVLNAIGWLPERRPIQTMDEIVFEHRRDVAATSTASVVIIGDSSSAIDVEAPLLEMLLPPGSEVVNQGLLMGLPIALYCEPALGIVASRAHDQTHVVLLFTPKFLVREISSPYHVSLWRQSQDKRNPTGGTRLPDWTAIDIGRERLFIPGVPWATHGRAGVFLPYVRVSQKHLAEHQGSRYDVGWFNPSPGERSSSWEIRPRYLAEAGGIRSMLGASARLYLGLTPLPESAVDPGFENWRNRMLFRLNGAVHADVLLTNLPATLPNGFCASEVHLNQRGAEHYTRLLATELAKTISFSAENNPP